MGHGFNSYVTVITRGYNQRWPRRPAKSESSHFLAPHFPGGRHQTCWRMLMFAVAIPSNTVWLCNIAMENGPYIYIHNLWWCAFKTLGFSIAILNDQKVIYLLTCWLTIANHQFVKLVDMEQQHSCCIINIGFWKTVFVVGGHQPNLIRLIMAHQRLGSKSV